MKNANLSIFTDLLFNMLILFVYLFFISFIHINIKSKEHNMEAKVEFIIYLTWDKKLKDDIDLYVKDPEGNLVFFRQKENGLMHLDRDDLGSRNDKIITKDGREIEYDINIEMVLVRGYISGEYIINVHLYNKKTIDPVRATVRIDKINPYSIVMSRDVVFAHVGQEITVVRFTVDETGDVIGFDDLPIRFIKDYDMGYDEGPPGPYGGGRGYPDEEDEEYDFNHPTEEED